MSMISPILQNRLNNAAQTTSTNKHEEIYRDLTRRANEVKPNEPKARMVKENPAQAAISSVKDTAKDTANFFKAVKTGKMNDNNLGRINDLGMKVGALIIATFLAAKSKTKTNAIMQFVGAGTFFGVMSLWPKMFINMPSKLLHKVDPGEKYISAQGDKKDFFLDNQFLVWDAKGISDEKEQRRQQKTALQNRTLWMATAGFATPLLTAMFGNFIEPKVENGVIKHDMKVAEKNFNGEKTTFQQIASKFHKNKPQVHNEAKINELFEQYGKQTTKEEKSFGKVKGFFKGIASKFHKNKEVEVKTALDDSFFEQLSDLLSIKDLPEKFRDPADDIKPFKEFGEINPKDALKEFYAETSTAAEGDLRERLAKIEIPNVEQIKAKGGFFTSGKKIDIANKAAQKAKEAPSVRKLSAQEVDNIIKSLDGDYSYKNIIDKIKSANIAGINIPEEQFNKNIANIKLDDSNFFEQIKQYNSQILGKLRKNAKSYTDILNPITGSRQESGYTKAYYKTMENMFDTLGFTKGKSSKQIKEMASKGSEACSKELIEFFSKLVEGVEFGSDEYKELIAKVSKPLESIPSADLVNKLGDKEEIAKRILPESSNSTLDKAFIGEHAGSLQNNISNFVKNQKTNIETIVSNPVICTNFEARLKSGQIQVNGKDLKENPRLLEAARDIIYKGNVSLVNNRAGLDWPNYKKLCDALFDENAFKNEPEIVQNHVKALLKQISQEDGISAKAGNINATLKYLQNSSLAERTKEYATKISNNKAWMKIFAPMTIALIGVTLLVQPFFGNIKKEFPEENKEGGNK